MAVNQAQLDSAELAAMLAANPQIQRKPQSHKDRKKSDMFWTFLCAFVSGMLTYREK